MFGIFKRNGWIFLCAKSAMFLCHDGSIKHLTAMDVKELTYIFLFVNIYPPFNKTCKVQLRYIKTVGIFKRKG